MEEIIKQLKDPSWWFNIFFIAIIAGIIAGFLKDKIERWIGTFSLSLREWRSERVRKQELVIEAMLSNEMYFHICMFRVLASLILFGVGLIIFLSGSILFTTDPTLRTSQFKEVMIFWKILWPIFGSLTVLQGFKATSRMSILVDAMKRYRLKNKFPKMG